MNELGTLHLRTPLAAIGRPTVRRTLTAKDAALMETLGVPVRPGDGPLAIRRLCELVKDLSERVAALERR